MRVSPKPRTASARRNAWRAVSETSKRALPIPTYCEPCPGKTKATGRVPYGTLIGKSASGDEHLPLDLIPGLADGAKLLAVLIGDLHPVLLPQPQHHLHHPHPPPPHAVPAP